MDAQAMDSSITGHQWNFGMHSVNRNDTPKIPSAQHWAAMQKGERCFTKIKNVFLMLNIIFFLKQQPEIDTLYTRTMGIIQ